MTTANRTAIGHRLAVRRRANRPPWSALKLGHRSIVASLAATVAATIALSLGLALARAEHVRRIARARRARERQFALLPGERLSEGLTRMALGQLDLAIEMLADEGASVQPERAVHETRKSIKRLRALIGLLRDELGEQDTHGENAILKASAARLARARDTEVMLNTLDALVRRHPKKLGRRASVAKLRERLLEERNEAVELVLSDGEARAEVLTDLRAARTRVAAWQLPDRDDIRLVEPSLRDLYRDGRRRARRADDGSADGARAMHRWRKRVKDLRYAAEILDRPEALGAGSAARNGSAGAAKRSRKRARKRSTGDYIARLAHWADELGELLGEEHDLAMLAARVRADGAGGATKTATPRATRKLLLRLIARRRERLRRRALRAGRRLYRRRPKKFIGRVRTTYVASARVAAGPALAPAGQEQQAQADGAIAGADLAVVS